MLHEEEPEVVFLLRLKLNGLSDSLQLSLQLLHLEDLGPVRVLLGLLLGNFSRRESKSFR